MEQNNEKNTPGRKSPAKRSKAFNGYIITIAINFFFFSLLLLIEVWIDILDEFISWQDWNAIIIWFLLLGSLITSLYRIGFGFWYLFIELCYIISIILNNSNFGGGLLGFFLLAIVLIPYIIYVREKVYYY